MGEKSALDSLQKIYDYHDSDPTPIKSYKVSKLNKKWIYVSMHPVKELDNVEQSKKPGSEPYGMLSGRGTVILQNIPGGHGYYEKEKCRECYKTWRQWFDKDSKGNEIFHTKWHVYEVSVKDPHDRIYNINTKKQLNQFYKDYCITEEKCDWHRLASDYDGIYFGYYDKDSDIMQGYEKGKYQFGYIWNFDDVEVKLKEI